jgi:hypothetical protein
VGTGKVFGRDKATLFSYWKYFRSLIHVSEGGRFPENTTLANRPHIYFRMTTFAKNCFVNWAICEWTWTSGPTFNGRLVMYFWRWRSFFQHGWTVCLAVCVWVGALLFDRVIDSLHREICTCGAHSPPEDVIKIEINLDYCLLHVWVWYVEKFMAFLPISFRRFVHHWGKSSSRSIHILHSNYKGFPGIPMLYIPLEMLMYVTFNVRQSMESDFIIQTAVNAEENVVSLLKVSLK